MFKPVLISYKHAIEKNLDLAVLYEAKGVDFNVTLAQ